jgi:hypothetical protein
MTLFVTIATAVGTYEEAMFRRESGTEQLIGAALIHAKTLRDGANAADDYGARAIEEEAERWERLAATARAELLNLRSSKQSAP